MLTRFVTVMLMSTCLVQISMADELAEIELKSIFKAHSQFKGTLVFQRFFTNEGQPGWELDGMFDLSRDGSKFRLEYNGFFGDMARWISDGSSMLVDEFGNEVELRQSPKEIWKFQDGANAYFFGGFFMQAFGGEAAFDAVVEKSTLKKTGIGDVDLYEFQHKYEAKCKVFVRDGKIVEVVYVTDGFSDEEKVIYRDVAVWRKDLSKFDKKWFVAKPESDRAIVDLLPPFGKVSS